MPDEPPMPSSDADPSLNEGFTEGGDLTLQSCDRINFSVHSLFLSVASPVFAGMFTVGTKTNQEIVSVGETAEVLSLMLKLIYPFPTPTVSSFDLLDQALCVADKYQLKGMKTRLREQMSWPDSPISISADPLRALTIACTHDFRTEADAATSLASKQYCSHKVDGLARLAKLFPSAIPFIRLIGVPSVRIQVLADALFDFHTLPMLVYRDKCQWAACKFCSDIYYPSRFHSAPEWQARWAFAVFTELKDRPVQEWDPFFKIEFFFTALHRGGKVPIEIPTYGTCTCPDGIKASPDKFEQWAATVLAHLKTRLQSLDKLEQLKMS